MGIENWGNMGYNIKIIATKRNSRKRRFMENNTSENSFMIKLASFIVDKRKAFILAFIIGMVFSVVSMNWVQVNNDITTYLPEDTQTRQGLNIMEAEFIEYGTARVMIDHITYAEAEGLVEVIEAVEGVSGVEFDETEDHYKGASALYSVTFEGEADSEISESAMLEIRELLQDYDLYVNTQVGVDTAAELAAEMNVILLVAVAVILAVLLFTSKTYAEIPVLLMTFGAAALLNMGTNYLMGEISFVTNSIAVVLQLALAIDYAIILCHRYMEEREQHQARESVILALSKAIPEISSSSLTTISGMVALMFMKFGIGYDMGRVLVKAILLSLLSVFLLMPALLMIFSKYIDKTHHRSFVPKITAIGKFTVLTRYVIPPAFIVLLGFAYYFSSKCAYVYGYTLVKTEKKSDRQIQEEMVENTFGSQNVMAMMVPCGNYEQEGELLRRLETLEEVDSVLGLANIEAMDGYVLTDKLTPRQFAELIDMDVEVTRLLYSAYALDQESYGQVINGLDSYGVPLIELFLFLYDQKEKGYVTLDEELEEDINDLYRQLNDAKLQLQGENYSRFVLTLGIPEEGEETFAFIDVLQELGEEYFNEVRLAGNSTSDADLASSFQGDNTLVSVLSALFVMVILMFTFQSAGLPVLLVLTIQGSIWLNFSFPYLKGDYIYFLGYLIISSIQMGATIDYAIVITSRYMELKQEMPYHQAMIESLNQAFPTIVTSGTILAAAGVLISKLSSDPAIVTIGSCLGRGTIISIILVLLVLPQTLMFGDKIIEVTAFTLMKNFKHQQILSGNVVLSGHVKGYVSGVVDADIRGIIQGNVNGLISTRAAAMENSDSDKEDAKEGSEDFREEQKTEESSLEESAVTAEEDLGLEIKKEADRTKEKKADRENGKSKENREENREAEKNE